MKDIRVRRWIGDRKIRIVQNSDSHDRTKIDGDRIVRIRKTNEKNFGLTSAAIITDARRFTHSIPL